MKHREKILLFSLLGILVLWWGQPIVDSLLFKPGDERNERIHTLETTISKKKVQERELERAVERLKNWSLRSLPPDPLIASSLYQNWLIELAAKSKLNDISVIPNRVDSRAKGDTYYAIQATVKARGTLKQLCDFLFAFRTAGLLHRVTRVSLEAPLHTADPALDMTFFVEALSLTNSPARKTLVADPSKPLPSDLPLKFRADYAAIEAKNLFVRGYTGPAPPTSAPSVAMTKSDANTPDNAASVYLVAALSDRNGAADAWLFDRSSNTRTVLTEGAAFKVAGIEGRTLSIGADFITLLVDGAEWRLELGEHLRQMHKLPGAPATGTR